MVFVCFRGENIGVGGVEPVKTLYIVKKLRFLAVVVIAS